MAPMITLYILGGCVAVAALLFIVMIVLSALRPPQLPDVSLEPPPPLQRMIRALTPLPFATATPFDEGPTRTLAAPTVHDRPKHAVQMAPAPPTIPARPRHAVQMAAAPPIPARPMHAIQMVAAPAAPTVAARSATPFAPSPPPVPSFAPSPPPVPSFPSRPAAPFAPPPLAWPAPSPAVAPLPPQKAIRLDLAKRAISLPPYPVRRSRKLLRVALGLFVTSVLAAGAVVAYPAMLDPLCDDYEWFGTEAAQVVRQHASDVHTAIADFIESL